MYTLMHGLPRCISDEKYSLIQEKEGTGGNSEVQARTCGQSREESCKEAGTSNA